MEQLEIRKEEDKMRISGYAAVFNVKTNLFENYYEKIDKSAFDSADLSEVVLRYNHEDSQLILASTKNNTLKLSVDNFGLKVEAELIDNQFNADMYKLIQAGAIDKMSFAFSYDPDSSEWIFTDEKSIEIIKKIDKVFDVSIVDFPQYQETSIHAFKKVMRSYKIKKGANTMDRTMIINNPEELRKNLVSQEIKNTSLSSDIEERQAFYKYIKIGELQKRDNQVTLTTDVPPMIPKTVLNQIIQKMEKVGNLYSRVRKLNIAGGVTIPTITLKPVASWVASGAGSERKKVTMNGNLTFNYYQLECKVAHSLIVDVASLEIFENSITDLIATAMVKAIETAIISGTGTGQPTGITVDSRIDNAQKINVATTDLKTFADWNAKVISKIPLAYDNGVFIMSKATFDVYINGLVDTTGQPIGRVNYGIDGKETYRFCGKECILVESSLLPDFATATAGQVVIIYVNPNDYVINSNMEMTMKRYIDEDTNQVINKALAIMDGKLADPNGVLLVRITPV